MGVFSKIFGSHSEREVKRILPIVDRIESMHEEMAGKTDAELKEMTHVFKKRLSEGETLDDILRIDAS